VTPTKPSGLGWAGDIPAHWDVAKICMVARLESGHTPSRQHPEYWVSEECTIPWFSLADVWQLREGKQEYIGDTKEKISPRGLANSAARLLPAGTVVLSRTASVGFAGIMSRPMATTQDFANWVCGTRLQPEYLLYALRAMEDEFRRATMGSTHQTIYMPDIRRLAVPVPPLDDQTEIVHQLRARLAPLDELISKKERLMDILLEERQAFINNAVTRGVRETAHMKDTGVEWLGEVPEHWTVHELRHRINRIEQGWSPSCENRPAEDGEWGVLKVGCVNYGRFTPSENKALPCELQPVPELEVRRGDVLISRANTRELVGSAALVKNTRARLLLCDKLFRIHYRRGTDPRYLVLLLQSAVSRFQLEREATGASGSMQNVGQDSIRRLLFAWAPPDEQMEIVAAVERVTQRIDRLRDRIGSHVERLREYRHAVVVAAVTGKLSITDSRRAA
jgi:type I restriction enzyme S subunit